MQLPDKKTKIVCTIGPASQSRETLTEMIRSGMDVTRLNFAHGDFDSHRQAIANIRAAAVEAGRRVAIMGDLPGPKMRIGRLEDDRVELERGQTFILDSDETPGDTSRVSMSFPRLPACVVPGDRIFLSDGFIQLVVQKATADAVECQVAVGGELRSNKGLNLPGIDLGISAFTEDDRQYLLFAGEQKLDAVSQSFVENASDLEALREAAAAIDFRPLVIAKIERSRAVDNLDAILGVADGLMVARGDLGVEIPIEEIAVTQKEIIRKANLFGKPVITATHMLESMVSNRRPTRAEATDVANAILDGTDCVMLSEETATGQYPVDAVRVMNRIAQATEPYNSSSYVIDMLNKEKIGGQISKAELISLSIYRSVEALSPVAVLTPTLSGATPRVVTRFRLPVWIVAVSPDDQVCQQLQFSYGVHPVLEHQRPDSWEWYARDWLAQHAITTGQVLLTKGSGTGPTGGTDQIEFIDLSAPPSESIVW